MAKLLAVSPLRASGSDVAVIKNDGLLIEEVSGYGLIRLQVFSRGGIEEASLAEQSGLSFPGPGRVASTAHGFIGWAAPYEWILAIAVGADTGQVENLSQGFSGLPSAATVITDSRVLLKLSGTGARRLLAMGSGVDYHPCAFKAGTGVTTKLAGITAMVFQPEEDTFLVFVDRSHADYFWAWIKDVTS